MAKNVQRRLAAILAADVVGYSRLIGEDEAGTLDALRTHREDLIEPKIAEHEGRVVKLMGDGLLAEFPSAVEAVQCAIEIQHTMAERNADVPEERRITYRIGINIGDIVVEGDDIYGDGVNIAARLEGLADPGGICISRSVHTQIADKLDLEFEDLGEQQVKNIAKPVMVYRVALDEKAAALVTPVTVTPPTTGRGRRPQIAAGFVLSVIAVAGLIWWQPWAPDVEPASVEAMAFPLPDRPSIAVLPFDNLSGDPEQDYFADGITENVITELARFPSLFVIAKNSTSTYKGKAVQVRQVSEELGVQYVLEGSVQRSQERIRISVRLVDATTGRHLWSERYDNDVNDVFAVQDQTTEQIVATLATEQGVLADAWRKRTARKGTESLEAYDLELRASQIASGWTKDDFARAKALYEKAIAADPDYARPYANLAMTLVWEVYSKWAPEESLDRAVELAKEAIARDDGEAWGHWALGAAYLKLGHFDQAIAEYEKALALNPNDADVLAETAFALAWVGRAEDGVANATAALRLNPRHPDWYLWALGVAYYDARRYKEAAATLVSRTSPNLKSNLYLAAAFAQLGRQSEAQATVQNILEENPDSSIELWGKAQPYQNEADLNHYIDGLRKAGLPEHPPLELPDKPSIAVLPFNNMSDNVNQEYFADGMTEDVITDLSKISGLFVIARNSSFAYKGQSPDVRQVARELGVRYVLEGSVRRAGDQVRINAQLIDATTGGHLWAERYDGTLEDIFGLQDKVTQQIVAALAVNLTGEEQAQQARHGTENAQAHDAYLQGWAHYKLLTPEALSKAAPFFEEAVRLDPDYAQAHAALASLYWDVLQNDWAFDLDMPSSRAENRANDHLEKAFEAPTPLAHILQSRMFAALGFPGEALVEAEKAVELDANDATTLAGLGDALIKADRPTEGLDYIEQAMRLDPHHPPSYLITLGAAQFGLERYEEAAETFERAVKRNPDNEIPYIYLASTYGHLGRIEDADGAIDKVNHLRNLAGLAELSLRDDKAYSPDPRDVDIDFARFGSKRVQDLVHDGLTSIPALKWQYLITAHVAVGPEKVSYRFEVDGATEINVLTAKAFYDRGVIFIDTSGESNRKAEGYIASAVHLSWERSDDPKGVWFNKTKLSEVADYDDEIVIYSSTAYLSPPWETAKAVTWGYQKVYFFHGGAPAWREAGYPVETAQ